MLVNITVNGVNKEVNISAGEYLLDTLRRIGVKSVKKGCNGSSCGACVVLVDDKPVLSCSVLTARVNGKRVDTVESIKDEASELSSYFSKEGADQCGFCNASLALMVHALKKENPDPSDEEIANYVVGNICRCTGYQAQQKAIRAYLRGGNKQ